MRRKANDFLNAIRHDLNLCVARLERNERPGGLDMGALAVATPFNLAR